ncbi:MAG TPA: hypothetical protein DEF92_23190 [Leclercia adecarboxylata]|nr:hypothetical protein [Leclercia adecarboxylata]
MPLPGSSAANVPVETKVANAVAKITLCRIVVPYFRNVPVIIYVAGALALSAYPSHSVICVPGDSLSDRLPATRII